MGVTCLRLVHIGYLPYGRLISELLFACNMEKPCENCNIVAMIDDTHRICYDCFVELDLQSVNSDQKKESVVWIINGECQGCGGLVSEPGAACLTCSGEAE